MFRGCLDMLCNFNSLHPIWNAMIETKYVAAGIDNKLGYTANRPDLPWFSPVTPSIVTAQLRTLRLTLCSTYSYPLCEYNLTVYSRKRERLILDFLTFLGRAPLVEDFALSLMCGRPYGLGDRCFIQEEMFYAVTTQSYLDGCAVPVPNGCMLLPRLRSLELFGHEIKLETMIDFCGQRRDTLRRVFLNCFQHRRQNIPQAGAAIRSVLSQGHLVNEIDINLEECYGSRGLGSNKGLSKSYDALIARGSRRSSRLTDRASDSTV